MERLVNSFTSCHCIDFTKSLQTTIQMMLSWGHQLKDRKHVVVSWYRTKMSASSYFGCLILTIRAINLIVLAANTYICAVNTEYDFLRKRFSDHAYITWLCLSSHGTLHCDTMAHFLAISVLQGLPVIHCWYHGQFSGLLCNRKDFWSMMVTPWTIF